PALGPSDPARVGPRSRSNFGRSDRRRLPNAEVQRPAERAPPGGKRQQGCVASVSGGNFAMGTSAMQLVHPPFVRDAPAGGRSGHPDGAGTAGAPGREGDDDLTNVLDRPRRGLISRLDRAPVAGSEDRGDVLRPGGGASVPTLA